MLRQILFISICSLLHANTASAQTPEFEACEARIEATCQALGAPAQRIPICTRFLEVCPYYPGVAPGSDSASFVYNCLYSRPPGTLNYYAGIIGTCSYRLEPTANLNLSIANNTIGISPSSTTADDKLSVKPDVATTLYVNVTGSGFKNPETRTAEVSLVVGNRPKITVPVSLAVLKAAGTLQIPFTRTFTPDEVGALDLIASIKASDDVNLSDDTISDKMYVLCDVADSGTPLVYQAQGGLNSWANDDYANLGPKKMKSLGCYTASFSMLMNSYGIAKSADGFSAIDPGSVNVGLGLIGYYKELGPQYSEYGGYTPSGAVHPIGAVNFARASYSKNCITGGGVPSECKAKALSKISFIRKVDSFTEANQKELNRQLCSGNPVILKVPSISNENDLTKSHFVLSRGITVSSGGEVLYSTFDPARIEFIATKTFNYLQKDIRGFRLYKQISDPSMISVHLAGGLHMVITDPLGNKTGYDPNTNQSFDSIAGGSYSPPESIDSPDGDAVSTPLESSFQTTEALDGQYQVQIFGDSNRSASYRLTRYSFDEVGNINAISDKNGILLARQSVVINDLHSSLKIPVKYASLQIDKALYFDSVRKDKAFVSGRILPEGNQGIPRIVKNLTLRVGKFSQSVEAKKIQTFKWRNQTHYFHYDWRRKGLAFEINGNTGEFVLYFDNIDLTGPGPVINTNIDIQIDDLQSENVVMFENVIRKKHGK